MTGSTPTEAAPVGLLYPTECPRCNALEECLKACRATWVRNSSGGLDLVVPNAGLTGPMGGLFSSQSGAGLPSQESDFLSKQQLGGALADQMLLGGVLTDQMPRNTVGTPLPFQRGPGDGGLSALTRPPHHSVTSSLEHDGAGARSQGEHDGGHGGRLQGEYDGGHGGRLQGEYDGGHGGRLQGEQDGGRARVQGEQDGGHWDRAQGEEDGGHLDRLLREQDGGRGRLEGEHDDGDADSEKLDPSEYELIEMDALEILAEHTHFCEICGKGFKRDANLRMHMRGHGDEYKTPAALARPDRAAHDQAAVKERRYSCPYSGCKRNKKHRKFAPLKTMLCVKNHYRRSHCPKMLTCQKCKSKKFSVVADLKTHEKHCGCNKWQCSCGTTFSRKDKLLGHISLFVGHTPAVPLGDSESQREMDSIDIGFPNPSLVQQQQRQQHFVNNSAAYMSGNAGLVNCVNGMISSGLVGANSNGVGHVLPGVLPGPGMQGWLADDSNVASDTRHSNSYSQPGTGLLPESSMLLGLFTSNFLPGSGQGSSSSDCLH